MYYFSYYLSENEELKFDIDDLFYYSNHKIMRRGGHLFVSDYGMQISILSRYEIMLHKVNGGFDINLMVAKINNYDPFFKG